MADLSNLGAMALLDVSTFKTLDSQPDIRWENTYHFQTIATPTDADYQRLANDLGNFEAAFHQSGIHIEKLTISTHVPDSKPYNPLAFKTFQLNLAAGNAPSGSAIMPLEVCLVCTRQVDYGKLGRAAYRGVVYPGELSAQSSGWVLNNGSNAASAFNGGLVNVAKYLSPAGTTTVTPDVTFRMVMITKKTSIVRNVQALAVLGVDLIDLNHKFFNRKPKTTTSGGGGTTA